MRQIVPDGFCHGFAEVALHAERVGADFDAVEMDTRAVMPDA
jgi:hypothetical protein